MRRLLKIVVALAGIAAIVGFIAGPYLLGERDSGRKLYVSFNEEILDGAPVPPGASEVERRSAPYYAAADNAPIAGYRTTAVYEVSGMSAADVIAFYRSSLDRWKKRVHGACRLSCRFVRGNASLEVDAHHLGSDGRYAVVADYAGAPS